MLPEISSIGGLPLGSVRMTDPYCVNAFEKEIAYLLDFSNDRVLAGFRLNAGLPSPEPPYGGWESHLIGGHAMGHYFTALAQASVNPGASESQRESLRKKLCEIIDGLAECQAENGFLWAGKVADPDNIEIQFDLVEQGRGNENIITVAWVPWYTMHKILEGLIAAYSVAGIEKAKDIAVRLGDWVCGRAFGWSEKVRAVVLNTEYGGMNDIMYELYRVTGDEKYAEAAHVFDEEPLFDRILEGGHNCLTGKHANTTIPKIIGAVRRYQLLGEKCDCGRYLETAKVFWDNVLEHHTYHTGGNSEWEHFRDDDSLDRNRTNCNCETCNVYNMLKLTRELFKITGEKKYADYLENAFINHILASQDPETGMTTYFQSMATGYFKVFSSRWNDFWCCTGSGMENFTKLGDSVFFRSPDGLWVTKYLSCDLKADGLCAALREDIAASGKVTLSVGADTVLNLRIPDWAEGFAIAVNGTSAEFENRSGFARIKASAGDEVTVTVNPKLQIVTLNDNGGAFALKFGPWLMAAKLGSEEMTQTRTGVAVAIPEKSVSDGKVKLPCALSQLAAEPHKYIKRTGSKEFELARMSFIPYYLINERYGIYWKIEE